MDLDASLVAPVPPHVLLGAVDDLAGYPRWLDLVRRADPAPARPGDPGPAWDVELRGRIGPLARSKRLRMVRTALDAGGARFERREADGRDHPPWVLDARVRPAGDGAELTMSLRYGGRLAGAVVERLLRDEVERARPRLVALVAGGDGGGATGEPGPGPGGRP